MKQSNKLSAHHIIKEEKLTFYSSEEEKEKNYLILNKFSNLRKLNSNRVEKLNYFFNHINTANNTSCNQISDSFNEFTKSINLIKRQRRDSHDRQNISRDENINECVRVDKEKKLNANFSLVEQILDANKVKSELNDLTAQSDTLTLEISKIDKALTKLTSTSHKIWDDPFKKVDFLKLQISKYKPSKTTSEYICINEYLSKIGANTVPLECFPHITIHLKHSKQANGLSNVKNLNANNFFNSTNQNWLKFEFIYGDGFYWLVKIKKLHGNLYQLKFMRTITSSSSQLTSSIANENDTNKANTSDISFNIDELNESSNNNRSKNESANTSTKQSKQTNVANDEPESNVSSRASSPKQQSNLDESKTNQSEDSISISNFSWLFSVSSSSSKLSNLLFRHLKPIGWSKNNARKLKIPVFNIQLNNDLYQFLLNVNNLSTSSELEIDEEHNKEENCLIETLNKNDSNDLNLFIENSYCELQDDDKNPLNIQIVHIKRNVAGRLLVEYLYDKDKKRLSSSPTTFVDKNSRKCWVYYLDFRVHPLGWAKANNFNYVNRNHVHLLNSSPINISKLSIDNNISIKLTKSQTSLNESPKSNNSESNTLPKLSQDHDLRQRHQFKVNFFMELLYMNKFYVARVTEIINEHYFKVKIDSSDENKNVCILFVNNSSNPNNLHNLFPCKWCVQNNIFIQPPYNWPHDKIFDWDVYINELTTRLDKNERQLDDDESPIQLPIYFTQFSDLPLFNWSRNLAQLSDKFQLGMYLECAVNNDKIYLAQIKAKVAHLIFLRVICETNETNNQDLLIYSIDSMNLFPVGWCEMNNYYESNQNHIQNYIYPSVRVESDKFSENFQMRNDFLKIPYMLDLNGYEHWCENIYLNTNCNCGPYFSKSKLNTLPKHFGPGPIILVFFNLIQMLISNSEKPFKLIKVLQASRRNLNIQNCSHSSYSPFSPQIVKSKNMRRFRLKAKERDKYMFRELEVCTHRNQLDEYLNDLCIKLKCCSKMLSLSQHPATSTTTMSNKAENKICNSYKCCILCTLNYYEPLIDQTLTAAGEKQLKTSVSTSIMQAKKQFQTRSISNGNLNVASLENVIKKPKTSIKLNKKADLKIAFNPSPIKTRFNVRQKLLLSLRQQELQQELKMAKKSKLDKSITKTDKKVNQIEKVKKSPIANNQLNGHNNKKEALLLKKSHKRDESPNTNEPSVKKSKKLVNDSKILIKTKHRPHKSLESGNHIGEISNNREITSNNSMNKATNNCHSLNTSPNLNNSHNSLTNGSFNLNYSQPSLSATKNSASFISDANMATVTNSIKNNLVNYLANGSCVNISSNPINWSTNDVRKYLLENKFDSNLVYLIEEHEIDGQSFLMLNLQTIQAYMNLKLGPAIKLAHLVEKLKLIYFQQYQNNSDQSS